MRSVRVTFGGRAGRTDLRYYGSRDGRRRKSLYPAEKNKTKKKKPRKNRLKTTTGWPRAYARNGFRVMFAAEKIYPRGGFGVRSDVVGRSSRRGWVGLGETDVLRAVSVTRNCAPRASRRSVDGKRFSSFIILRPPTESDSFNSVGRL